MFDQQAFVARCLSMNPGDTLSRTLWGEGRNQGTIGMQAIACVVLNRNKKPERWSHGVPGVVSVCISPWQFSCWNPGDPNLEKLLKVDISDPQFRDAIGIAHSALAGAIADMTKGADSYHTISMATPAVWGPNPVHTVTIGDHAFYIVDSPLNVIKPQAASISSDPTQETADQLMANEEKTLGLNPEGEE